MKFREIPQIDLFASRLNRQLPKYMSWHPDPGSCAVDYLQHSWRSLYGCVFPPFCLIGKVLAKVWKDQSLLLIITPAWQTQPWYEILLSMLAQHPIILLNLTTLLQGPQGQKHPLQEGNQLHLVAMEGFRKALGSEGVSKLAATLFSNSRRSGSISKLPVGLVKVG